MLFQICKQIQDFLEKDDENVIIIHCKHGRGRTGLMVCCYLLYSQQATSLNEAINLFTEKRNDHNADDRKERKVMKHVCQIKYLKYFQQVLNSEVKLPKRKFIKKLKFSKMPLLSNGNVKFTTKIEILQNEDEKILEHLSEDYHKEDEPYKIKF